MIDFIQKYYIDPIVYGTGYNIYNTITYGILFAAMVFGIYRLLQRWKIRIDERFFIGILPYIVLGPVLRVLQDAGILNSYLLVTPLLFFLVFAIALAGLWLSRRMSKEAYHKLWFAIGAVLCITAGALLTPANPGALLIVAVFSVWAAGLYAVKEFVKISAENTWVMLAHIFDATTTFVAIQFFPYTEQHVVAGFVISALGPWSMYLLKIPVVAAVLWLLDKDVKDSNQKTFIKIAILLLGLAPGLRNFLRLLAGV